MCERERRLGNKFTPQFWVVSLMLSLKGVQKSCLEEAEGLLRKKNRTMDVIKTSAFKHFIWLCMCGSWSKEKQMQSKCRSWREGSCGSASSFLSRSGLSPALFCLVHLIGKHTLTGPSAAWIWRQSILKQRYVALVGFSETCLDSTSRRGTQNHAT